MIRSFTEARTGSAWAKVNGGLSSKALALGNERYVIRGAIPFAFLTPKGFDDVLRCIGIEAAAVRQACAAPRADLMCVAHHVD